jgi:hypothetical protein
MFFIKRIVDTITWLIFISFFLLGIFLYLSKDARPGNYLYSFKQNFGNIILGIK